MNKRRIARGKKNCLRAESKQIFHVDASDQTETHICEGDNARARQLYAQVKVANSSMKKARKKSKRITDIDASGIDGLYSQIFEPSMEHLFGRDSDVGVAIFDMFASGNIDAYAQHDMCSSVGMQKKLFVYEGAFWMGGLRLLRCTKPWRSVLEGGLCWQLVDDEHLVHIHGGVCAGVRVEAQGRRHSFTTTRRCGSCPLMCWTTYTDSSNGNGRQQQWQWQKSSEFDFLCCDSPE